MSPLTFALRRPITVMVALAGLIVGSGLALWRMKIDIFPDLNLPVVYVVQPYGGMDPAQMERGGACRARHRAPPQSHAA